MKKVVITGGQGDIAKCITKKLILEDYDVFCPGKDELDVTNPIRVIEYMDAIKPDVLINNAGYVVPKSIKKCDIQNTKKHIMINLLGTFYCTEACLKNNPNIVVVNIGSAAAVESHATWSEYCASKAGVVMATKCWADDGVYAVVISPGRTKTKMRHNLFPYEDSDKLLMPEDFAKVVVNAVNKVYPSGTHLIVRKQTIDNILHGKI